MRAIILVAILCLAAASRTTRTTSRPTRTTNKVTTTTRPPVPYKRMSKQDVINFLNCYKKVLLNGNKELGIPSYNPYLQPYTYNITKQLGPYIYEFWTLLNQKWYGKAQFTSKIVEIPTPVKENSQFNYTFVWPVLRADGEWERFTDFNGIVHRDNGKVGIEITNRVWKGVIRISRKGVLITMRTSVDNVKFTFTQMDKEKVTTEAYYSNHFKVLYSSGLYGKFQGNRRSDEFTRDWLFQPKRMELLKKVCQKTG